MRSSVKTWRKQADRSGGARQASANRRMDRMNQARLVFQDDRPASSRAEKKNVDSSSTALITAGQTTGNLLILNGLGQGAGQGQRIGRSVMMKSLYVRWQGSLAATTAGHSPLRFIIVYDK